MSARQSNQLFLSERVVQGGFKHDPKDDPWQIDPGVQNRHRWHGLSAWVIPWTKGSARAITGPAGDPIGNSFRHTGSTISARSQISDGEWEKPSGCIGVIAPHYQVEWADIY